MPADQLLIFIDTTELSNDSTLSSPIWDSLAQAVSRGHALVAISEVSILEISRQVDERARKHAAEVKKAENALRAHGIACASLPSADTTTFESDLRRRLAARHVHVVPLPTIPHEEVVRRDLSTKKPFSRDGKGYRDFLIWRSFLDCVAAAPGYGTELFFVSGNTNDFGENGRLHRDLRDDLPSAVTVTYTSRISDVVTHIRPGTAVAEYGDAPTAESTAIYEALQQFQGLRMSEWDPTTVFAQTLWPVEEASITSIEVDEDDLEALLVDTVSDTGIWEVRGSARLEVEGFVYRGEVHRLDPAWYVSLGEMDDRYVEASRTIECDVTADVRVEADEVTSDGTITKVAPRNL